MIRYIKINICLLWILLGAAPSLYSQSPQDLFNQGLILYRNMDYEQAKLTFLKLVTQKNNNPLLSSSILMLAKSFLQLEQFDDSIFYAEMIIEDFPSSTYLSHAHLTKAGALYKKGAHDAAFTDFVRCIETAGNEEFLSYVEKVSTAFVTQYISQNQIQTLLQMDSRKQARPNLLLWSAQRYFHKGQDRKARQTIDQLLESDPPERYVTRAETLLDQAESNAFETLRIGLVQPVSGYFAAESQDFLRGLAFALTSRKTSSANFEFFLKDTEGNLVQTILAAQDLFDADLDCIIGELETDKAALVAGLYTASDIPVIIPLSTDNHLTDISSNIFQINNDIETRSAALARYAFEDLQMRTFATLAPTDDYGNSITDAFTYTIDQLGGTIVSQQWYYPGTTDFSNQFQSIRESGFRYAFRDSLKSWGMDVNLARIDSIYARLDRRARIDSDDNEGLMTYTDIAVRSIDGLFLPVYVEDIPYVASQFALYNIKSRILGGENWNNADVLRRHQRDVNSALFIAGSFLSESDLEYIEFVRDFRVATSTSPGIMAVYGYNIMNLIINAVDEGQRTGRQIIDYLKNVNNFEGLGTTISFSENRVNDYVNILQFQDGNIIKIK